jgi:hypothetical protein
MSTNTSKRLDRSCGDGTARRKERERERSCKGRRGVRDSVILLSVDNERRILTGRMFQEAATEEK